MTILLTAATGIGGRSLFSPQGASRYDHSLHLGSALIKLGYLGVAVVSLHRIAFGIAVSAVDLDGLARHSGGGFRPRQLGHRPLRGIGTAVIHARRGAIDQKPG